MKVIEPQYQTMTILADFKKSFRVRDKTVLIAFFFLTWKSII